MKPAFYRSRKLATRLAPAVINAHLLQSVLFRNSVWSGQYRHSLAHGQHECGTKRTASFQCRAMLSVTAFKASLIPSDVERAVSTRVSQAGFKCTLLTAASRQVLDDANIIYPAPVARA